MRQGDSPGGAGRAPANHGNRLTWLMKRPLSRKTPGSLRELVVSLREEARERSAERDLAYEALKLKTL